MTARLERVEIADRQHRELNKRQHVPYRVMDECPFCGVSKTVDLANGDDHLSLPRIGEGTLVYFCCGSCGRDWQARVVVNVTLTLADAQHPINMRDVVQDLMDEAREARREVATSNAVRDKLREVIVQMRDKRGYLLASNPQLPGLVYNLATAVESGLASKKGT